MTQHIPHYTRRTALQTVAGVAVGSLAGCLNRNSDSAPAAGDGPIEDISVDRTELVVEYASTDSLDQLNLIQPNGELFGQREIASGSQQVTFEIGTAYEPGEYTFVALSGEDTLAEISVMIRPDLQIRDVGLYRNNPDKPWDEIYGDTETDRKKNGEAFVTVENVGSGPDTVMQLRFAGDVPNPIEEPRGNGIYETEQVVVPPDDTTDLFSSSFPFGTETESGMGCSPNTNSGQFRVIAETGVSANRISHTYNVQYSSSDDMTDCEVAITEA